VRCRRLRTSASDCRSDLRSRVQSASAIRHALVAAAATALLAFPPTASAATSCRAGLSFAGIEDRSPQRFDGVEATVTPEHPFSGLDGRFEQVSALIGIGDPSTGDVAVTLGSHVDGRAVGAAYEFHAWGAFRYLPIHAFSRVPREIGSAHTLRLQREVASPRWRVIVDRHVYGSVSLTGSEAGLRYPRVYLTTRNVDLPCNNHGLFRFAGVRVLPVRSSSWVPFPLDSFGGAWPGYHLEMLSRTSFFAGDPPGNLPYFWRGLFSALVGAAILPFGWLLSTVLPLRHTRRLRRAPTGRDFGLSVQMAFSVFLLELLYLPWFALGVLFVYGITSSVAAAVVAAAFELGLVLFIPLLSERVALAGSRARTIERKNAPELHAVVERLSALADLPMPRLAVIPSNVPDAYSTGHGGTNATIAVSAGLLERLEPAEVEAVIAHELSHIANQDAFVMTLVSLPATVVGWLLRPLISLPGRPRSPIARLACYATVFLLFGWLLFLAWIPWALGYLVVLSFSRSREHLADRGAVVITGAPEQLMSALVKIADELKQIPQEDMRRVMPLNAFYIVPVLDSCGWVSLDPLRIFPSHPPLEQRLARLSTLARQLGHAVSQRTTHTRANEPSPKRPNPAAKLALASGIAFLALTFAGLNPFSLSGIGALAAVVGAGGLVLALHALGRAQAGAAGFAYAAVALGLFLIPWLAAVGGGITFIVSLSLHLVHLSA
jgi:heat shock protein HtpX